MTALVQNLKRIVAGLAGLPEAASRVLALLASLVAPQRLVLRTAVPRESVGELVNSCPVNSNKSPLEERFFQPPRQR